MFTPKDRRSVHLGPFGKAPSKNTLRKLALQKDRGRKPRFGRERPSVLGENAAQT